MSGQTPGAIAPPGYRLVGVARAVRDAQITGMASHVQDSFIRDVLAANEADLRAMVGGIQANGPLSATVTGPHDDTLLGYIHVHTVAGYFREADLPADTQAGLMVATGTKIDVRVEDGEPQP